MSLPHTLHAQKLSKNIGSQAILQAVSLQVTSGEVVGLLGPNGAGKTTLFYSLVGQIHPDDGQILLDNSPVTTTPMHERIQKGMAYLPQDSSIFRQLSIEDNIMAALELDETLTPEARNQRLEQLLTDFNLHEKRHILGLQASGGERRRAEIARALAREPLFFLMDEPFAGIDPVSIHTLKDLIRQLAQRGIGVLITDHNVAETLRICDRAYLLHQGDVLCSGAPATLTAHPQAQRVYFGKDFQWQ